VRRLKRWLALLCPLLLLLVSLLLDHSFPHAFSTADNTAPAFSFFSQGIQKFLHQGISLYTSRFAFGIMSIYSEMSKSIYFRFFSL
jgi:hypothetical protein